MKATVVITSFNYGRYLSQTIESALAQTWPTEVIVVDDGSEDDSPSVMAAYSDRVHGIVKENGGQASAMNAGFAASSGDLVCFVDSDDILHPGAMQAAQAALSGPSPRHRWAKAHWYLEIVDGLGRRLDGHLPVRPLGDGDLLAAVLADGPANYGWPPTSGNVWTRGFLETALPIPTDTYRTSPDLYLAALAPAYGGICAIDEVLGQYRVHESNNMHAPTFEAFVGREMPRWDACRSQFVDYCSRLGIETAPDLWESRGWVPRLRRVLEAINEIIPADADVLLLDNAEFPDLAPARRVRRLMENAGVYWGLPRDSSEALAGLGRARNDGVRYLVHPWTTSWWRETYPELFAYLGSEAVIALECPEVTIYELAASTA